MRDPGSRMERAPIQAFGPIVISPPALSSRAAASAGSGSHSEPACAAADAPRTARAGGQREAAGAATRADARVGRVERVSASARLAYGEGLAAHGDRSIARRTAIRRR